MIMHHVLIILTLTFIQGHTYLNQTPDLDLHSRSQLRLKQDQKNVTGTNIIIVIYRTIFKYGIQTWHAGRLMHGIQYNAHSRFDDLDVDARSEWVSRGKQICVGLSRQQSKQVKLAAIFNVT